MKCQHTNVLQPQWLVELAISVHTARSLHNTTYLPVYPRSVSFPMSLPQVCIHIQKEKLFAWEPVILSTYPFEVVLIEDDAIDTEAILRSFRGLESPPHLTVYRTAKDALQALHGPPGSRAAGRFLVLLDLSLPGMTGLEFLERIRSDARFRGTVIFVLTGSHDDADIAAAYDATIAGYMRKSN